MESKGTLKIGNTSIEFSSVKFCEHTILDDVYEVAEVTPIDGITECTISIQRTEFFDNEFNKAFGFDLAELLKMTPEDVEKLEETNRTPTNDT